MVGCNFIYTKLRIKSTFRYLFLLPHYLYLSGVAPGPSRCSGPGSGCAGLRCAAVLRTAPVARSLPIPHLHLPQPADAPATIGQRAGPHSKKRRPFLPKPAARAGRHSTAGATLRSVPSFAPCLRSLAHYACRLPPLRSVPRSTHPPAATPVTSGAAPPHAAGPRRAKKAPRRPSAPPYFGCRPQAKNARRPLVRLAFQPRRQKQGPLRGGSHWGAPQTPATMPRLTPGHLPRLPQPPDGRLLLPQAAGSAE